MDDLRAIVEQAFDRRAGVSPGNASSELLDALDRCLALLGSGAARVAEPADSGWRVNEWLKKAVLLYFRSHENAVQDAGALRFYDKLPLKYAAYDAARFRADGVRVVPGAIVRVGAHVATDAVLMPCFINVGA
ncbi:MAG: 2,3,4,5-tetrahydropyridine-2,6-dicarboxylate N-succinyltransferase, partial [Steroidobacteraceae bacterium]